MEAYLYALVFIFGAIIGSFLNVVIYRLRTGKSINGRSHCMSCGTTLSWRELFPIASYLFQKGRCVHCGSWITPRYLLVELMLGLSFVFLWNLFQDSYLFFTLNAILVSVLMVIIVYDLRHMIIPDELSIFVAVLALVLTYVSLDASESYSLQNMSLAISAGFGAAAFFAGLWFVSRGRWMGLGDAKLAFSLGTIVGVAGAFSMVMFSFWIGALVSVLVLSVQHILKRGKTRLHFRGTPLTIKSEVPFAPYLVVGFALVHFFNANVFEILLTILSN